MAAIIQPADPEEAEVSTIGRSIVEGAIIGWFGVALAATLLGVAGGMSLPSASGFAALVASFGGLGFGAMLGGTIALTHDLESQPAAGIAKLHEETPRSPAQAS